MSQKNKRVRRAVLTSGALAATSALVIAPMIAQADKSDGKAPSATAQAANGPIAVRAVSSLAVAQVRRDVTAGKTVVVKGSLQPLTGEHPVSLQVNQSGGWRTVDKDATGAKGDYALKWKPRSVGSRRVRLSFAGNETQAPTNRSLGYVNVYRSAVASYYGPGLYGNKLGCGGHLTPSTIGVANKSLPCGTKITLHYKGRTVRASVVDRGPFVAGREFDLTAATKNKLRFGTTGRIQVSVKRS